MKNLIYAVLFTLIMSQTVVADDKTDAAFFLNRKHEAITDFLAQIACAGGQSGDHADLHRISRLSGHRGEQAASQRQNKLTFHGNCLPQIYVYIFCICVVR